MSELTSLGIILLLALVAGHLVKFLRIPEVTGYIFAGVLLGPSVLNAISHENLRSLQIFSEVALGLILFSVGAVFDLSRFREIGRNVALITVVETATAAFLVAVGSLLVGASWPVALLLGVIAMETAAASTLMVIREENSSGPLTETLTGIIAINNIVALVCFTLLAAGFDLATAGATTGITWGAVYGSLFPLVWQLVGSLALGFLVGLMLAIWASQVIEQGEILILLAGCVLLTVGVSQLLDLSPLVASLAVGATMVNLSKKSRALFDELSRTDPPLYAIFFVIAGADLNLALLPSLGMLGVVYIVGRAAAKLLGARHMARRLDTPPMVQKWLGPAMLSQAGLAVGLLLTVSRRFPEYAATVTTVVLAAVAVFEIVGPIGARVALVRAGESNPDPVPDLPAFLTD